MLISEFVGNEEVKNELAELIKRDTLPHAMIIEGAKGTGKKNSCGDNSAFLRMLIG